MALSKITHKKELEYVVPDSLPSNLTSLISPTGTQSQIVVNPVSILNNLIVAHQNELTQLSSLISQIPQSPVYSVPTDLQDSLGVTNYSSNNLQAWLNTGGTEWPTIITDYENNQWNSTTSTVGSMLYGVLLETQNELQNSLNNLQNYSSSGKTYPSQISNLYNYNLNSAATLRNNIEQAIIVGSEKLAACYIQKFGAALNKNGSTSKLVQFIKAARAIIKYYSLGQKTGWGSTRKNILNTFLQNVAETLLFEAASKITQLESASTNPIISIITEITDLINQNTCDAFSQLTNLLTKQAYNVRAESAAKLIELQKSIDKKYGLKNNMVQLATTKSSSNTFLQSLDLILAALQNVFTSGRLDTQLVNFYNKQQAASNNTSVISGILVGS